MPGLTTLVPVGTVARGKSFEQVVPSLLKHLRRIGHDDRVLLELYMLEEHWEGILVLKEINPPGLQWTKHANKTLLRIIEILDEMTPEGLFFGPHPENKFNFGHWPTTYKQREKDV